MTKISAKFTAAMRLLDAHKETLDQPHTSRQPIMVGRPHDVYLAWLHSWTDEFNFRLKTTRETSSVIDEINEEFLKWLWNNWHEPNQKETSTENIDHMFQCLEKNQKMKWLRIFTCRKFCARFRIKFTFGYQTFGA